MTRGIDGTSPDACVLQVLGRAACRGPARRWCRSARPLATLLPIASAGSVSRLPHAMCGLCQRGGRRRPPSPRSAHAAPDVTLAMGAGAAVPSPTVTGPITGRQRYGSPLHPGDSFSYDIFSQAGEAIRHPAGVSAIGGLTPAVGKATNRAVRAGFVLKSYARLIKAAAAESDIGK